MSRQSVFAARLRALLQRRRLERELDDELRFHLEMQAEDNVRAGMDPGEARHAAARSFGGAEAMKETYRDRRSFHPIETLVQDLRYAVRTLRKSPAFTITAVLSLAIGIGANTAVFSFADTLLLRPLTVPRPGELLTVGVTDQFRGALGASFRDFVDIRDRSTSFDGLTAFAKRAVALAPEPGASPKLGMGALVTEHFFQVMGVAPALGRDFLPGEHQVPGRDPVVILGHDFWVDRFGADTRVLGRTIRMNGIEFTVVGVAPPGFTGPDQYLRFQFYAPLMMWPRLIGDSSVKPFEARDFRSLGIGGRLKSGVDRTQAEAELSVIAADLERAYPEAYRNRRILVRTELQNRVAQAPPVAILLMMLTLLSGAVLFVACANVAGLLASRAPVRAREMALRLAIGAGRARVIRQLMTESLVIAFAGGVLGLAVGFAGVRLFQRIQVPNDLPFVISFALDRRALLFSLVAAFVSAVLFGVAPAIRSTRTDLTSVMKATDAAGPGGRRWGRAVLVCGQVAVSVVLLVVATYIYRGFQQQIGSGPGFRTDHLLMMSLDPGVLHYDAAQSQSFFEQLVERARRVPGVRSATLTRYMPMDGLPPSVTIVPEGYQFPAGRDSATHATSVVDADYFETIGAPILQGRGFLASDVSDSPNVAVVNQVLAERYWPRQDPIGKRFRVDGTGGPWVEVVGLAKTTKYGFVIEAPTPFVYLPFRQRPTQVMFLLVQSIGEPSSLAAPLREIVRGLDRDMPVANVRTMQEQYRMRSVDVLGVVTTTIGAMGVMGLTLAVVGLYGLVAYAAGRRTKEIGIRMAIGAARGDVLRMVLRQGVVLVFAGLGIGLLGGIGAARSLAIVFPGGPHDDNPLDVVALVGVAATALAATLLAAYVPARRASRVHPLEALRYE